MLQGNTKALSSVQSAAAHNVPRIVPCVTRVSKSSKSLHHGFKNNTKRTKPKSNNIIHVKIRPPTSTAVNNITNDLLSFSSILTTHRDRIQANQSSTFQNSSSSWLQNSMENVNVSVPVQHDQPLFETSQYFGNSDNFKSNSDSYVMSPMNITSQLNTSHGENPERLSTGKKCILQKSRVSPNQNTNNIQSVQVSNSESIEAVTDARWNKINSGKKDFKSLGEIETNHRKKNRFPCKPSRRCVFLSVLAILLISGAIAGTVAGILVSRKGITTTTTETTTTITTQTTTTETTTTSQTTTSVTTTSTTTSTTTTTITTTTTTSTTTITTTTTLRPVLCPSAVWHPNATTIAGSASGVSGSTTSLFSGPFDVIVDSAIDVYVSDFSNNRVMKWLLGSTNGTIVGPQLGFGTGSDTQHLNRVTALCFDSTESNLYMSDTFNCRILKWNIASNNITIVVGGIMCGSFLNMFNWCDGLYVDRFGNIYLSDYNNHRVLKFPSNSNSSTMGVIVAGTGTAGGALNQLNTPANIYVDESDNDTLYVVDYGNHRVMKWLVNSTNGTIIAGNSVAGTLYTQLWYPRDLFVDSFGTVYVSDSINDRIMKWPKNAINGTLVAGISGSGGVTSIQLNDPRGIQFDTNGNLYVADYANDRVQRFTINNTSC